MKLSRRTDWPRLKALALGLGLPHVVESTSWGEPCLKAHGKLWVWWSPSANAPVFKVPIEEREILLEAEPDTFFITDHYRGHPLVLVRPERFDAGWAVANLQRVWRSMAPRRVLKAFDAAGAADALRIDGAATRQRVRAPAAAAPAKAALPGAGSRAKARKPRPDRRGCQDS